MDKSKFIIISTADWDNPFWTNKQHVANTLSELGHSVVYFDSLGLRSPTKESGRDLRRMLRRLGRFFKGPRTISENLTVFSPLVIPKHSNRFISYLNSQLMKLYLIYFEFRLGGGKIIYWSYNPLSSPFLKGKDVVYHCVDDLTAAPGLPGEKIKQEESSLLKLAGCVFVTSKTLKSKFEAMGHEGKIFYFPNVIDDKHFGQALQPLKKPHDLEELRTPIIGFVGAISSYKLDFQLVVKVAQDNPASTVVMIGQVGEGQPETDIAPLQEQANIVLLGPKSYQSLPEYLKYFDVALLPCPINDYTRSMFPMKFFEYLAAGKKVVSTNLDSLSGLEDCCFIARNQTEFLKGVKKALSTELAEFRDEERIKELLRENTWLVRTKKMLDIVKHTF